MKKLIVALAAVLAVGVLGAGVAGAQSNMAAGSEVTLAKDQTIDASYYAAGETLIINGTVKGDLYCAGTSVEVNGTVEGDVLCAGMEVRIDGNVQGNIRAAGQNVFIEGDVQKSITVMGQMISVDGKIGQDATITGQTARINGEIGRDLVVGAERLTLLGSVARNVEAGVETVTLRDEARIGGNLSYTSYNEVDKADSATVAGITERHTPTHETAAEPAPYAWVFAGIFTFIFLLPIALVWLALMPRIARRSAEVMKRRWLLGIALGLLALVFMPIVAIALMVTVIGLPLGFITLFLWLLALPVAFIMAAYSFGTWLIDKAGWTFQGHEFVALLLGLMILVFFASLPYVGWIIALVSIACGLGGIALLKGEFVINQYRSEKRMKK